MTVVLLAHGSPDPRHSAAVGRLAATVAGRRGEPGTGGGGETLVTYLDHDDPRPAAVAPRLSGAVAVVPLLLTPAFHAREDVPAAAGTLALAGARVRVTDPLGGHPALVRAVAERLRAAGHNPEGPACLVAGGSSGGEALSSLRRLLRRHAPSGWRGCVLAGGSAAAEMAPGVPVVPFTLAEGVLHDRVAALAEASGAPFVPGGLADSPALVDVVLDRVAGLTSSAPEV